MSEYEEEDAPQRDYGDDDDDDNPPSTSVTFDNDPRAGVTVSGLTQRPADAESLGSPIGSANCKPDPPRLVLRNLPFNQSSSKIRVHHNKGYVKMQ